MDVHGVGLTGAEHERLWLKPAEMDRTRHLEDIHVLALLLLWDEMWMAWDGMGIVCFEFVVFYGPSFLHVKYTCL